LNGDGDLFQALPDGGGITFGEATVSTWVGPEDGLLAVDLDGDGLIDRETELVAPNLGGGDFADSLAALMSFDSNGDGVLNASDDGFGDLFVWQDANSDSLSTTDELFTLDELGITEIDLNASPVAAAEDGQQIFAEGVATTADGGTVHYAAVELLPDHAGDIWL